MGFSITAIRSVRRIEEREHSLYRLPVPSCKMKVKPLRHGKVIYIIKGGKKVVQSNGQ